MRLSLFLVTIHDILEGEKQIYWQKNSFLLVWQNRFTRSPVNPTHGKGGKTDLRDRRLIHLMMVGKTDLRERRLIHLMMVGKIVLYHSPPPSHTLQFHWWQGHVRLESAWIRQRWVTKCWGGGTSGMGGRGGLTGLPLACFPHPPPPSPSPLCILQNTKHVFCMLCSIPFTRGNGCDPTYHPFTT